MPVRLLASSDVAAVNSLLGPEPVLNLALLDKVGRAGLDNIGLNEQGYYFGAFSRGRLEGLLCHDNQAVWLFHVAAAGGLEELASGALESGLRPACIGGTAAQVDGLLAAMGGELGSLGRIDQEVVMLLAPSALRERRDARARFATPDDIEALVELEGLLQRELLGSAPNAGALRGYIARAMARDPIAVCEGRAGLVSKADVEARVPGMAGVGGVVTATALRREGLASASCSLLCRELLATGSVTLNVASSNLAALGLYRGLGFLEYSDWRVAVFD
ncbi:MAG: GNAT family N-acetyltransferase [Candidatus Geothermincolia bacterium]